MNDPQFVEAARLLAERMLVEGGPSEESRIAFGFKTLTSMEPTPDQMAALKGLLGQERIRYASAPAAAAALVSAGEYEVNRNLRSNDVAAYTTVATTIMNFDATQVLR